MPFDSIGFTGYWDASANKIIGKAGPGLRNDRGQAVQLFRVAVSGTTQLGGITNWQVDDWAYFDGYSWGQFLGPNSRGGGGGGGGVGPAGRGISSATVDPNGHLILFYTDSTLQDVGSVMGAAGRSITGTVINGANHLIISYSDGTSQDAGAVAGGGGVPEAPSNNISYVRRNGSWTALGSASLFREYRLSDYNATADDGTTNSRAAFAAIIAAIDASSTKTGTIIVPPGEWRFTGAPIDLSNRAIQIKGSGRGVSRIVKADNGGVFYANHNQQQLSFQTHIQGLSLWTTVLNTGTAVEILYDVASGGSGDIMNAGVLDELDIRGYFPPDVNQAWAGTAAIRLTNAIGGLVSRCSIRGPNNTYNQLSRGISLEGTCSDFTCRENRVYFADIAFYQSGNSETIAHEKNTCLLCNYGLYAVADGATNKVAGGSVDRCHYNTRVFGIRIVSRQHWRITNNLNYRWTENGLTHVGIQVEDGNDTYIAGNAYIGFKSAYGGTTTAVVVANCVDAIVLGNKAREANVLLDFNNTSTGVEGLNICPTGVVRLQSTQAGVGSVSYGVGGGIPEAPTDGQLYGRKSSAWAVVPAASGGGLDSNYIELSNNRINAKKPYQNQVSRNYNATTPPTDWDYPFLLNEQENVALPGANFYSPFYVKSIVKSGASGFRSLGNFVLESEGATSGMQMTSVTPTMHIKSGRGVAFGICIYALIDSPVPNGAGSAVIGMEVDTSVANGFVDGKVGIQVIDVDNSTGYGTEDDVAFVCAHQNNGAGYRDGFMVGLRRGSTTEQNNVFGVKAGGCLFGTAYTTKSLRVGLDLSQCNGGFTDAAVALPNNAFIGWKGVSNAKGGGYLTSVTNASIGGITFQGYGQSMAGQTRMDSGFSVSDGQNCVFRKAGSVNGVTIPALNPFELRLIYQTTVPGAVRGDWFHCNISSAATQYRGFELSGVVIDDNGNIALYAYNKSNAASQDTGPTTNLRWIVERFG